MIRIGGLHRSREGSGSAREERNGFGLLHIPCRRFSQVEWSIAIDSIGTVDLKQASGQHVMLKLKGGMIQSQGKVWAPGRFLAKGLAALPGISDATASFFCRVTFSVSCTDAFAQPSFLVYTSRPLGLILSILLPILLSSNLLFKGLTRNPGVCLCA